MQLITSRFGQGDAAISPLESFVRDYVEARGGVWDEIEPQVYDLLVGPEMSQVAFDPEALPEHPEAQLASLGSPLLDRFLGDAARRWNFARFYRIGLNLHPHDVESRAARAISLPPGAGLRVTGARAMNFPQAVFWFKAIFASDQKEEEILPVGIDLHYLRESRHLENLLAMDRLSTAPLQLLPESRNGGIKQGYRAARQAVARTVAALANARRRRDWSGRVDRQVSRMIGYYAQLRSEAAGQSARGADAAEAAARLAARREAIDREERLRIAELRQKSALHVSVKLASVMEVLQPKLALSAEVMQKDKSAGELEIIWDSLTESIEPPACPRCGHPTLALQIDRKGIRCANCPASMKY